MRTIAERIFASLIVGFFSGTISVAIVSSIIGLDYGLPFETICCNAFLFMYALFGGPIGACVGIIVGVFIGMTDYTSKVEFKWGIAAGLGAALGTAFITDASVEIFVIIVLTSAITGELVARCIAALFIERDNEPGARGALLGYISSSLLIVVAVNRYLEWWMSVIAEID